MRRASQLIGLLMLVAVIIAPILPAPAVKAQPATGGLPARVVETWSVELSPPRQIFGDQSYTFTIPGTNQVVESRVDFQITLFAAQNTTGQSYKYLVISSSGSPGFGFTNMYRNTNTDRGYYLERFSVAAAPGAGQSVPGLALVRTAPATVNRSGAFAVSTGISAGLDLSGPAVGFEQSEQATIELADFSVDNSSGPGRAGWSYRLSQVGNGRSYQTPADLRNLSLSDGYGTLYSLPPLASGATFNPASESVWSVPGDFQGTLTFRLAHQAHLARIYRTSGGLNPEFSVLRYSLPEQVIEVPIDFSQVNYIGDLSVRSDEISIAPSDTPGTVALRAVVRSTDADYEDVKVQFYQGLPTLGNEIGDSEVTLATRLEHGRRTGAAVAEVLWPIAGLPGTQLVTVVVVNQAGERDGNNNSTNRQINLATPAITVSAADLSLAEGGPPAQVEFRLRTRPTADLTLRLASEGQVALSAQALTFTPDSWDIPQTLSVSAIDDAAAEGPQRDRLGLLVASSDNDYRQISLAPIPISIADNDNLSPKGLLVAEGGYGDSYLFQLTRRPSGPVSVQIDAGAQLSVSPASLSFAPGQWDRPQRVFVSALDDEVAEGTHSATISHRASSSDPSFNNVALEPIAVSIQDNDVAIQPIVVGTTADELANDGLCSLREAVLAANSGTTLDSCTITPGQTPTIELAAGATYDLTITDPVFRAQLDIDAEMVINGNGATIRNRAEDDSSRLFDVGGNGDLILRDVTLRDGRSTANGGAMTIFDGRVSLERVVIRDNLAGPAAFTPVIVGGSGGAILNAGRLYIRDSALIDNRAADDNPISGGGGGAISNDGLLSIVNTTFSGNRALNDGGAIYVNGGEVYLSNVTLSENTADADGNGEGQGGGIVNLNGRVFLHGSVVASNFDTPGNAGPNADSPDLTRRTNRANSFYFGPITSLGYNVIGSVGAYNFSGNSYGDLYGDPLGTTSVNQGAEERAGVVEAGLGALQGSLPAYGLSEVSPALDRIPAASCLVIGASNSRLFGAGLPLTSDQQGQPRPIGLRCDSGALEARVIRVGVSTSELVVPTGGLGNSYQIVLAAQPDANVVIRLSAPGLSLSPDSLTFTPANWNQPQAVRVLADAAGLATVSLAADATIGHLVSSADARFNGLSMAEVGVTLVEGDPAVVGARIYLPLVRR